MTAKAFYLFCYRTLRQCHHSEEIKGMKERWFEPLREKAPYIAFCAEKSFRERNL